MVLRDPRIEEVERRLRRAERYARSHRRKPLYETVLDSIASRCGFPRSVRDTALSMLRRLYRKGNRGNPLTNVGAALLLATRLLCVEAPMNCVYQHVKPNEVLRAAWRMMKALDLRIERWCVDPVSRARAIVFDLDELPATTRARASEILESIERAVSSRDPRTLALAAVAKALCEELGDEFRVVRKLIELGIASATTVRKTVYSVCRGA